MASDAKLQAWFTFLQAHDAATESLDAELRERSGITLSDYEVLLYLDRAPRLERDGFVRRAPDPHDGRATLVSLTAAGRRRFRAAAPVHLEGVRARFLDALTTREAETLRAASVKVLAANGLEERMLSR